MNKTKLVGILNITPDSFSDGGAFFRSQDALVHIKQLANDGAYIIDIGAESTRPGATPLSADEEWQRLEPVLKLLPQVNNVQFSLDTRHAQTARKALAYNIHWINDVSGFSDLGMQQAVRNADCKLVVMHSLSVPADKNIVLSDSLDAVEEILGFAKHRIQELENAGIKRDRIIFDPGIGFGKTASQSWEIVRGIKRFEVLGVPLLVGHSRKSFLSSTSADRDAATLAVSRDLINQGVSYLRVHDVAAHARMLSDG